MYSSITAKSANDKNEQQAIRNALLVFAVGAFAYGDISAAKDILSTQVSEFIRVDKSNRRPK